MDGSTNSLDDMSAESSTEFPDRVSLMEVRLQAQEDEITLLKSSLADALRKLHLHDQQIPLLKQQLIAVNPAAARVFSQSCHLDGLSKCRLSTSSPDATHHIPNSLISLTAENGVGWAKTITNIKPGTSDRYSQTDPWIPNDKTASLALTQAVKNLSLDDALPEAIPFTAVHLPKLHREEYDIDEDDIEKEHTWSSGVEDTIQPTTIRTLQKQQCKDSEDIQGSCPQSPTSFVPAPLKEITIGPCGTPLSPIQEGQKLLCVDPQKWIQALSSCLNSPPLVLRLILTLIYLSVAKNKVTVC